MTALIALLHALRSTRRVVDPQQHGLGCRELDARAREIAEGSGGSQVVRHAVDAIDEAVMTAVTVTTLAASG